MSLFGRKAYRHSRLGFEIQPPSGSEIEEDIGGIALVIAEGRSDPLQFRTNLVVTEEAVPVGSDVELYTDTSLSTQAEVLNDMYLIDRASTMLDGAPATRTLCHHMRDGYAITLEQWRVIRGDDAYTLSASCSTLDYWNVADALRDTAASFRPGGSS